MIQRVNREQPFQVLASNFSIGPSSSGYDLEISADGVNYTTLFSVGSNVTRLVTSVANGSYYRLGGNTDEDVAINWRTQCNDGGSGGGSGSQGPQGTAGAQGYQGPAGGGEGSSAYKIELSTANPDDFTEEDIANLNAFVAAAAADPSIADSAYLYVGGDIYSCSLSNYAVGNSDSDFTFVSPSDNYILSITLHFYNGEYVEGFYYDNHFNYLFPFNEFPADPVEGQITNYDDGNGNIGLYRYDGEDWVPFGGGDNTILKSVSAAPETMELNDVAVLGNNLSQFTGYEDVVSAYTLVKMYNGSFAQDAGAADYVNVRVTGNTNSDISVFTIGGSYITTPLGRFTPGSEVYTDWTDVGTGITMKYDAGNDELDLRVASGFPVTGQIVNKSGAALGPLSSYVVTTSVEEHFQGDPIYEQYAKRGDLSVLSAYWTSAETQTAIQNEATQLVGYVDASVEQVVTQIPEAVSQLINDEEFVSSANLKTINNESIVGTGNISIQGGGDSHILKSSSGTPANLGAGDVYATYKEAEDAQIGNQWVDTNSITPSWDRSYDGSQPQAIRVEVPQGTTMADIFNIHYACNDYDTVETVSLDGAGKLSMNTDVWTPVSANHWVLSDAAWVPSKTDGNVLYVDYDGTYVYIYSTNVEKLWIMGVEDNSINQNVYTGEVTPPLNAEYKVFQAISKLEPNVKIELEGNASVDGTLDNPSQIVTMSDGSMKISFYDNSNIQGVICDLESNGTYFHLYYDSTANDWTLYDSDEENILINITDGESDSADFGDGNVYLSYSGGVLTAYTDYDKGWTNWNMGDTHEGFTAQELAKVSDLPNNLATRLLPENPGAEDMVIYSSDAWRTTSRDAVFIDGLHAFQNNWVDDGDKYIITRTGDWNFKWEKLDLSISNLKAVSALPVTTTDGDVIPYANASGYGIVQAQSGTTGYAWVEGNTEITGNTQIRVPYTSNDSGYIEFTFENSTNYHNLWWHYEDGNYPHWDGDNVPIDEQVDGEFSGQDGDGETITCVRSGDYLIVTFGSPVVSVNNVYNTEVYTEAILPTYKEVAFKEDVVTSTDIKRMVKISQAGYDALVQAGTLDNETIYYVLSNDGTYYTQYIGGIRVGNPSV